MRKFLPIFIISLILISLFVAKFEHVFAQNQWVADPEVTFVGKAASRADNFLTWTLQNYNWICVQKIGADKCNNANNPLIAFWSIIYFIVIALTALFILAAAFIMIITRGQSITLIKFAKRFVFIVVFATLSFAIMEFILIAGDIVQGFFLRVPVSSGAKQTKIIDSSDLLHVDFNYENFEGYRLVGSQNDESAFITLVLVRITAITYYVMTGVLLIRKIILWFFVIISPIFPLLFFYRPIRNTGKIWIGEFFRWLLYGPLFAIFLQGLVVLWRAGIPLAFDFSKAERGDITYPTAVNILLGGPKQIVGINNSVNLSDTFAHYVIALLMLWVVVLLPFLLLKIFLDYLNNLSFDNLTFKQMFTKTSTFFGSKGPVFPPPTPPGLSQPTGMAKVLPFFKGKAAIVSQVSAVNNSMVRESTDILRQANINIPRLRDVARFETSSVSRDVTRQQEVSRFHQSLKHIESPHTAVVPSEREKFRVIKEKLVEQKQKGNIVASSVLSASSVLTTSAATVVTQDRERQKTGLKTMLRQVGSSAFPLADPNIRERIVKEKHQLEEAKTKGNQLASDLLSASEEFKDPIHQISDRKVEVLIDKLFAEKKKGNIVATSIISQIQPAGIAAVSLPIINKVQQVSIEEYEQVRKMWLENYQNAEPPKDISGRETTKHEWIKNDIEKVNQAIASLSSQDQQKVKEGMSMVSNILPFLLIGGFSKSEVISYLKAKAQAGSEALAEMKKKEEEEDTMLSRGMDSQAQKEMTLEQKAENPLSDIFQDKIPSEERKNDLGPKQEDKT